MDRDHPKTRSILTCCISAVAGALLLGSQTAEAQSELRPSVIGGRTRRTIQDTTDYNLKIRAISFKASAGLRGEYNDNITLSENNKEGDIILTPYLDISAFWPVTPFNSLRLSTSIGYRKYLDHSELDSSSILFSPDSELSFDVFVGNFILNFHDRFSVQQDPVGEPSLSNVADFGRFTNTIGVTAWWTSNRNSAQSLTYDHTDFVALNSQFDYSDYSEDQLAFSSRYTIQDNLWGGLEGGIASTRYRTGEKADANTSHVGLYAESIITPYTRVRAAAGVQFNNFDGQSSVAIEVRPEVRERLRNVDLEKELGNVESGDDTSYYWNLEFSNRLRPNFNHSFSLGHESQLAITSERIEFFFARYSASWNVNQVLTLNGNLFYENGKEYGAADPEKYERFGAGLSTSYQLSRKLSTSLGYNFFVKDSSLVDQSYKNNRVFLQLTYDF